MAPKAALRTATLLALLLLLALPATAAAQDTRAMVRVVHLSADAPEVDLYVDGTRTLEAVSFKTASKYRAMPAGTHTLAVRPAGSAPTSTPTASVRASVRAGAPYTAVLLGPMAQLKAVVVEDDFTAPPAGRAKLRVIDAAPQSPPLDLALADGPVLFRDLTGAGGSASDQAWRPAWLLPVVGLLAATAWAAGRRSRWQRGAHRRQAAGSADPLRG